MGHSVQTRIVRAVRQTEKQSTNPTTEKANNGKTAGSHEKYNCEDYLVM